MPDASAHYTPEVRTHDEDRLELRSLQQQVHDRLLGRILRGELQPGERISPPEIAANLGVSITPVRDAVNQMAAEGLVTVTPRRGTVVSPVSIRDIEELYEIRLMVEPQAAEMAAGRASETEIARVLELAERLESGPETSGGRVDDLDDLPGGDLDGRGAARRRRPSRPQPTPHRPVRRAQDARPRRPGRVSTPVPGRAAPARGAPPDRRGHRRPRWGGRQRGDGGTPPPGARRHPAPCRADGRRAGRRVDDIAVIT